VPTLTLCEASGDGVLALTGGRKVLQPALRAAQKKSRGLLALCEGQSSMPGITAVSQRPVILLIGLSMAHGRSLEELLPQHHSMQLREPSSELLRLGCELLRPLNSAILGVKVKWS